MNLINIAYYLYMINDLEQKFCSFCLPTSMAVFIISTKTNLKAAPDG